MECALGDVVALANLGEEEDDAEEDGGEPRPELGLLQALWQTAGKAKMTQVGGPGTLRGCVTPGRCCLGALWVCALCALEDPSECVPGQRNEPHAAWRGLLFQGLLEPAEASWGLLCDTDGCKPMGRVVQRLVEGGCSPAVPSRGQYVPL